MTVIVLNWNGRDDTLECLDSVSRLNYGNVSVIVVDNGSADDSVTAIKARFPGVTPIETGRNLGYAGGNNVGIRAAIAAGADYVLLLNNDTVVDPKLLDALVAAAQSYPEGGLFGAKILYYQEPEKIWVAGARWNRRQGAFQPIGRRKLPVPEGETVIETDYVNGCALFVPVPVINRIGLLDEDFFLTYEETDWSYRARKAGYRCLVALEARVWHKVSASIGGSESPLAGYFWARNQLVWAKRHLGFADRLAVGRSLLRRLRRSLFPPFVLPANDAPHGRLTWAIQTWIRDLARNWRSPSNRALLLGLRDYLRGRMGDCPEEVRRWTEQAKTKQTVDRI